MTFRPIFSLVVILTLFVPNSHQQNHLKKIDIDHVNVGNNANRGCTDSRWHVREGPPTGDQGRRWLEALPVLSRAE